MKNTELRSLTQTNNTMVHWGATEWITHTAIVVAGLGLGTFSGSVSKFVVQLATCRSLLCNEGCICSCLSKCTDGKFGSVISKYLSKQVIFSAGVSLATSNVRDIYIYESGKTIDIIAGVGIGIGVIGEIFAISILKKRGDYITDKNCNTYTQIKHIKDLKIMLPFATAAFSTLTMSSLEYFIDKEYKALVNNSGEEKANNVMGSICTGTGIAIHIALYFVQQKSHPINQYDESNYHGYLVAIYTVAHSIAGTLTSNGIEYLMKNWVSPNTTIGQTILGGIATVGGIVPSLLSAICGRGCKEGCGSFGWGIFGMFDIILTQVFSAALQHVLFGNSDNADSHKESAARILSDVPNSTTMQYQEVYHNHYENSYDVQNNTIQYDILQHNATYDVNSHTELVLH